MLRIEHLTKTFGDKVAVDDLSLHIAPGEIYGFIGHNGAGKTTTLRSAVGIQSFDSGEIYICGTSIKADPLACKRQIAYAGPRSRPIPSPASGRSPISRTIPTSTSSCPASNT